MIIFRLDTIKGVSAMEEINSDSTVAGELASGIFTAMAGLSSGGLVVSDGQSTISGNEAAQQAITEMRTMIQTINAAIATDANNLKSVAAEFEAADETIRRMVSRNG